MTKGTLGRFGHHPDPAIDFEIEVEILEGAACNYVLGIAEPIAREEFDKRMFRVMQFRVGGDPSAVAAKDIARNIEKKVLQ